jgi:hypothetical protein
VGGGGDRLAAPRAAGGDALDLEPDFEARASKAGQGAPAWAAASGDRFPATPPRRGGDELRLDADAAADALRTRKPGAVDWARASDRDPGPGRDAGDGDVLDLRADAAPPRRRAPAPVDMARAADDGGGGGDPGPAPGDVLALSPKEPPRAARAVAFAALPNKPKLSKRKARPRRQRPRVAPAPKPKPKPRARR